MSNMNKAASKLKGKLSFDDYGKPSKQQAVKPANKQGVKTAKRHAGKTAGRHESKPASQHNSKLVKQQDGMLVKPNKGTFYLSDDAQNLLTQVYIKHLKAGEKVDKSTLICRAIELLYKKEL